TGSLAIAPGASLALTNGSHIVLGPSGANVLRSGPLTIQAGGLIDLGDNDQIIDYGTPGPNAILTAQVRQWIHDGVITTAAATPTTRLGYGDNAVLHKTTFSGQSVGNSSMLIKYTYAGDSDLDGDADGVDIGTWATNFTGELGGGAGATRVWTQGDWDYDGDVDGVDAGLWATAFTGELGGTGLGSVVVDDPSLSRQAAQILEELGITVV